MDRKIEPTRNTPCIVINGSEGEVEFWGRSSPESARDFYNPIIEDIKNISTDSLSLSFHMQYFNTSTSKCFHQLIKESAESKQNSLTVNWFYENWDEDMKENGEDFEDLIEEASFNFITE